LIKRAAGIKNYEELLESSEGALEEGNKNQKRIKKHAANKSL